MLNELYINPELANICINGIEGKHYELIDEDLINLAQKHLKKLRGSNAGLVVFYEKQLTELCSRIGKAYPAHMNLPQQGSFQLGYYCQTQARYQKKEEAKDV